MSPTQNLNRRMSRGVAWMVLFKVAERGIALVSMVVLARLLVPADFGLVVLATSLIGLLEVLGAFGLDISLIRQPDTSREHFDAVWTFKVLFGLFVGVVAASLAPVAAWLYDDPRLVAVMLTLAAARAVAGFENTGVVNFRKELQFDREVSFMLAKRLVTSLLMTIPLALALRSYWALLLGNLFGACFAVALSYVAHPYRPRPSLRGLAQLMTFSKWLLVSSLMEFLHGRAADLIIGRMAGAPSLGAFNVAQEIARLPTGEIAAPVHRAVFPGYVKLAGEREPLRRAYLRVAALLVLIVLPAGAGLCVLAEPAVALLLGRNWMTAVPIVQLLALHAVLNVLLGTAHHVNLAVGMARSTSLVLAMHVALSLPLMLWLVPLRGAAGAAAALLLASILTAPLNFVLLAKAIRFDWRDVVAMLWRPSIGALAMSGAVIALRDSLHWPSGTALQIAHIALLVAAGALVYASTIMLCWFVQREPESAEAWVIRQLRAVVERAGARIVAWYR